MKKSRQLSLSSFFVNTTNEKELEKDKDHDIFMKTPSVNSTPTSVNNTIVKKMKSIKKPEKETRYYWLDLIRDKFGRTPGMSLLI